jgi:hypothetical protein
MLRFRTEMIPTQLKTMVGRWVWVGGEGQIEMEGWGVPTGCK